jgi:hypothetical protein
MKLSAKTLISSELHVYGLRQMIFRELLSVSLGMGLQSDLSPNAIPTFVILSSLAWLYYSGISRKSDYIRLKKVVEDIEPKTHLDHEGFRYLFTIFVMVFFRNVNPVC